jgi:ureidoglycolate lyase
MDRQISTFEWGHRMHLAPLTAEALAPFGSIVVAPANASDRSLYTQWLGSERVGMTPRFHVNLLLPAELPYTVQVLERHVYSAQFFVPLDVARYVVVVAPTANDGTPDLAGVRAFLAPANVGVVYAPGTWHAGATVLERPGSFAVLMWRNDSADDEEFLTLESPLEIRR